MHRKDRTGQNTSSQCLVTNHGISGNRKFPWFWQSRIKPCNKPSSLLPLPLLNSHRPCWLSWSHHQLTPWVLSTEDTQSAGKAGGPKKALPSHTLVKHQLF